MKPEFITVQGRVVVERDILFIRPLQVRFSETIAYPVLRPLLPMLALALYVFVQEEEPKRFMGIVIWSILTVFALPQLYRLLFRESFASRIPLQQIRSVACRPGDTDLETLVDLHLQNGRTRTIRFRKREGEYEALVQYLSLSLSTLQTS